jgi:ubiquitin carboxyl-terminal hydrolase 22/27/51
MAIEHMGEMFENARKQTLQHYRAILSNIHEKPSIIAQTYNKTDDTGATVPVVSLKPLFLCLQCPNIMTEEDRDLHFETKSHCFSVESRAGNIYCGNCQDFIYDEALEVLRLQKGTHTEGTCIGTRAYTDILNHRQEAQTRLRTHNLRP